MSSAEYPKPKPGGIARLEIDGLSVKGQGVGTYGDYRVLVRGSVPGDTVVSRFRKVRHRRREGEARVVERVGETIARVDPACEHFETCGGCLWQDIPYAQQVALKERLLRQCLHPGDHVEVAPTLAAPGAYGYRNKMEFSIGSDETGTVQIGLHPAGRFGDIFDVNRCELVPPAASEIVAAVRVFANEHGLPPYDLKSHQGLLRFLTIREGSHTGEVMVILTTSGDPFPEAETFAVRLREAFPYVESVVHVINREKAQVAFGDETRILQGKPAITDHLGPFTFEISPSSFFQPNAVQAARMFDEVVRLCGLTGSERVLDAYCGTGGISLFLSPHAERVVGVEVSEDAIRDAARNSARNGVTNCEFVSGPAENLMAQLGEQGDRFDVAVTDPPRAGMHHKALRGLIDLGPERVVYVSCNPAALASDLETFEAHGYRLNHIRLVDMLPQTPHCEILARLDRT